MKEAQSKAFSSQRTRTEHPRKTENFQTVVLLQPDTIKNTGPIPTPVNTGLVGEPRAPPLKGYNKSPQHHQGDVTESPEGNLTPTQYHWR